MSAAGLRWSGSERAWLGVFEPQPNGRVLCRRELTWYQKTPEFAAKDILPLKTEYVVAQATIFPKTGEVGETVSETLQRAGIAMREGSSDRLALWSRLRSWLAMRDWPDGTRGPALLIHPDCRHLIRTIPSLVQSETEPDDVEETPDEYPAMGVALYAMSRPSPWQKVEEKKPIHPLSGAALWQELRDGDGSQERTVGWNRYRP